MDWMFVSLFHFSALYWGSVFLIIIYIRSNDHTIHMESTWAFFISWAYGEAVLNQLNDYGYPWQNDMFNSPVPVVNGTATGHCDMSSDGTAMCVYDGAVAAPNGTLCRGGTLLCDGNGTCDGLYMIDCMRLYCFFAFFGPSCRACLLLFLGFLYFLVLFFETAS